MGMLSESRSQWPSRLRSLEMGGRAAQKQDHSPAEAIPAEMMCPWSQPSVWQMGRGLPALDLYPQTLTYLDFIGWHWGIHRYGPASKALTAVGQTPHLYQPIPSVLLARPDVTTLAR